MRPEIDDALELAQHVIARFTLLTYRGLPSAVCLHLLHALLSRHGDPRRGNGNGLEHLVVRIAALIAWRRTLLGTQRLSIQSAKGIRRTAFIDSCQTAQTWDRRTKTVTRGLRDAPLMALNVEG